MALDYLDLHWGERGERRPERLAVARVRKGDALVFIGKMRRIVYRTKKGGDADLVDYEHDFATPYPELYRHSASGRLVIAGGRYRVEDRGIVENGLGDAAAAQVGARDRLVQLGDLIEVTLVKGGVRVPRGTPRPRLCLHNETGLLVLAGGAKNAL